MKLLTIHVEMGVSESVGSDVPNLMKNVPNLMKDVPNFVNDVPSVQKCCPKRGSAANRFVWGFRVAPHFGTHFRTLGTCFTKFGTSDPSDSGTLF